MIPLFRKIRTKLNTLPCLIILPGILNGFPAVYFFPDHLTIGMIFLCATPGLLLAWLLFGLRNTCCRFIPATFAAILSSIFLSVQQDHRFQEQFMGQQNRLGAEAVFRLTDPSLCGGIPKEISNAPYFIRAELCSAAPGGIGDQIPARENVLLTVSPGSADLDRAGYGDLIRAKGYFERIPTPVLRGTFDFPAYAAARKSSLLFHAEQFQSIERGTGFFRSLYDLRGRFLEKLLLRMPDKTAREMAPALFFGIRQPIKGGIKQDFLLSGTLHVLSVSGFHIGLFFLMIMGILSLFPYRFRWLFAPVPVLLYALSTGMQAPAMRAFLMLTFWCFSQVLMRKNPGFNALAAAAAVILLLNPYQLFDVGFLYSFLCVFFLLLCSGFYSKISRSIEVREQFLPDRRRFSSKKILRRFVVLIGVSAAAWLSGLAISMNCQSLLTPWAIPAYLLMLPVTYLCFALFLPAILLQWIPGVTEWIGYLASPLLDFCASIAEFFADRGSFYLSTPPVWLGIIYLCSLIFFFLSERKRTAVFSGIAVFLLCAVLLIRIPVPDPEIAILRNGAAPVPAIVFSDPVSGHAVIWNLPSGETGRLVSDYLKTNGINRIEEVHFDSARSDICGGGLFFLKLHNVKNVYFHGPVVKQAKTALRILKEAPPPSSQPILKLQKKDSCVEVQPGLGGMNNVKLRMIRSEDTGVVLELERAGEPVLRKEYPYSSGLLLERITLPARKRAEWRSLPSRAFHQVFPESAESH